MGATTITTNGKCADIKEGSREYSSKATGKEKDMQEIQYDTSKETH